MKNIRRAAKLCLAKYALRGKVHAMPNRSDAEEHLRIIRSLMEKATIYRAISAEAAAVGGVLAIAASFALGNWFVGSPLQFPPPDSSKFLYLWLAVLAIVGLCNGVLLYRGAARRGEPFVSTGMKMAVKALLPNFLLAGFFTVLLAQGGSLLFGIPQIPKWLCFTWIVPIWISSYGLALLATAHFAPRSLWWLGWAFLLSGIVAFPQMITAHFVVLSGSGIYDPARIDEAIAGLWAQRWMAGTFGLFHLIYAACTWPRRGRGAEGGAQP